MKKQEFKEKAKLNIDRARAMVEELELKIQEINTDTNDEYEEQIQNLKKKKAFLQSKYVKLSEITEDKWDETKEDFISAMHDLKSKIKNIME